MIIENDKKLDQGMHIINYQKTENFAMNDYRKVV